MMLNVAVIGCGYWGPNLVRNFNSLSECDITTVCDACDDRLSHMQTLYPHLKTVTDSNEVFNDKSIDAVAIATPVKFHYELAMKSLQAGKHTFIEKPMASSVDQCRELLALAREQGLTLMVGHTFIYSPPVRKIKELVDSGDLGGIQYVSSRRLNLGLYQKDINVSWDLAPHDIAIILYVLNDQPVSVNCQGKAHVSKGVEDVCNMTINFANGGFCTIQSSWLDPNKIREMTFVGEKRMLVYNDLEPIEKIKIYDKRVEKPPHYDTFAEFHYSYHYGDMYSPYLKQFEPLKEECQHFIDCIKTKCKSISGGLEGLKVVQILSAASESLRQKGAAVSIGDLG
jgi:predicted dehydrogenase